MLIIGAIVLDRVLALLAPLTDSSGLDVAESERTSPRMSTTTTVSAA